MRSEIIMKKVLRWIGIALLIPITLVILVVILIYTPPVQNLLKQRALEYAAQATGFGIEIERIRLTFPLKLTAEGIRVISGNDTLANAERLDLHVKLLPLFRSQVDVNGITLTNAHINSADLVDGMLINGSIGELFVRSRGISLNTQEALVNNVDLKNANIILALNDTTEAETDTTSTPLNWKILVENVSIDQVAFELQMPADTLDLMAFIRSASLDDIEVDLKEQLYMLSQIRIENSSVDYNSGNSPPTTDGLDPSHIMVRNFNASLDSVHYRGMSIGAIINDITLVERSGLEVSSLRGTFQTNDSIINVPSLSLQTPHSYIDLAARASWSLVRNQQDGDLTANLTADIGKEDVFLFTGRISDEFQRQYPFRPIMIVADVDGNMQRATINEFRAELPGAFRISASGELEAIMDSINRRASVTLDGETGNLNFVLAMLDAQTRQQFAIPQNIRLNGTANLAGSAITADMTLAESTGRIRVNGAYDMALETYRAALNIDSLQLHHFMPRDSFYSVTASANVNGTGFDIFSPRTRINADLTVNHFEYGQYIISGIDMLAALQSSNANVTLNSNNPLLNLQAGINGLIQRNLVEATVNLNVVNVDLYALQMIDRPLDVAFKLNMEGASNLNLNHSLSATIADMRLRSQNNNYYPKNITLNANTTPDTTTAVVNAGDLLFWARATGSLRQIADQATQLSRELMAQIDERSIDQNRLKAVMPNLYVHLNAGRENPLNHYLQTINMGFRGMALDVFTSPADGLYGDANIFSFNRDSLQFDTIRVALRQDTTAIRLAATVANNAANRNITFRASLDGEVRDSTARALLRYYNADEQMGVELGVLATLMDNGILINLLPEQPTFVYRPYTLNPDNYIFIGNNRRVQADITLLDENGSGLRLYSLPSDTTTVLQDIAVELRQINIGNIAQVVPYMPDVNGILSAEVHYTQTQTTMQVAADVELDNFAYQGNTMGNVHLEGVYLPGETGDHHIDALLSYEGSQVLQVGGVYYTSQGGGLDANATLEHFPLNVANFFIPNGIAQLTGDLDGQLSVQGQLNTPQVNGQIALDSVFVLLPQYGIRFRMDDHPLRIEESVLHFDNFNIYTNSPNPFVVAGNVNFANLSAINADMSLNATDYEILNAERTSESILFGRVVIDLTSTIRGPIDGLTIRGGINIQGVTNATYILTDSPLVTQDRLGQMVTFVDFRDSTRVMQEEEPSLSLGGMDMLMTVSIDDAARVRVDITGDGSSYVEVQGGGDLSLQYTALDGLQLSGRYTLLGGSLRYTLIPFLAREFSIQEGSYVQWSGNVMDPYINLTAINHVRASVRESDGSSRNVAFNASLLINNTLEDLQLVFGLDAPEDLTIRNELAGMSEEERSKQAVAMMITGTYMGPSGGGNMGGNALNSLLQGAIQGVAGSALKTIDITLGVEQSGNSANPQTDYSFTFSRRFWNDRVNIIIGGTVSTGANAAQADRQSFIDNVAIEYRLDNTGRRYIRLFHHTSYDNILDGEIMETGVGAVFRRKVARLKDLFSFRRRRAQATPVEDETTSSIY